MLHFTAHVANRQWPAHIRLVSQACSKATACLIWQGVTQGIIDKIADLVHIISLLRVEPLSKRLM